MRNFFLQAVLITGLVAGFALSAPPFVFAQTYGECAYGEDVYGTGCTPESSSSGGGGTSKRATPVSTTGSVAVASTSTATATTGGLTSGQKQSILDLIASFGADTTTLANVTAALNGQSSSSIAAGAALSFTRDLEMGMTDEDVRALQQYLNAHGSVVAASGDGSLGQETDYFGTLTYQALVAFQNSHAEAILHPLDLAAGTGFFGPVTRAFVNTFHE